MQLNKGTLLQGRKYRIEKVLGQGGFGITYLATQTNLNRKVAIKEFFMKDLCSRNELTNQVCYTSSNKTFVDNFKKKFSKEARTISALNHPNIIRIYDNFEENGTAYYAMEYIDGASINDILNEKGKLQENVALQYIREVANALHYIHSKHINHLDIKPGNIMVRNSDNTVVLIDFGVAKQYDLSTDEGTTSTPVGVSHGYSPIEQYSDGGVKNFSPQSDIYALGATLYRMVIGEKPPHAISISQNGFPEFPNTLSKSIRSAIIAAMKQKRSERPQSIEAFINILNGQDYNDETVVVNIKQKSKAFLWILGILLVIGFVCVEGYIRNSRQTTNDNETVDTHSIDTLQNTEEPEKSNEITVKNYTYKRNFGDNNVIYSIDYPVSGSPNLSRNVMEWMNESFGGQYKGDLKNGKQLVDYYGKNVEFDEDYNTEVKNYIRLRYQTDKYVTFEHESYFTSGGAHGTGQTICATFRKDDGRKFGWDMFSNYDNLQSAIKQGLKEYFNVATDLELEEHLQLPEDNTINSLPMPSTDPWLTPNGITLHYNAYEIACYAEGEPTFTIPFSKIKNCLTSSATDLISE